MRPEGIFFNDFFHFLFSMIPESGYLGSLLFIEVFFRLLDVNLRQACSRRDFVREDTACNLNVECINHLGGLVAPVVPKLH